LPVRVGPLATYVKVKKTHRRSRGKTSLASEPWLGPTLLLHTPRRGTAKPGRAH